jgi:hypothetical protein
LENFLKLRNIFEVFLMSTRENLQIYKIKKSIKSDESSLNVFYFFVKIPRQIYQCLYFCVAPTFGRDKTDRGVTADAEPRGSAPRGLRADPRGRRKKFLINKKIEIAADPRGAESARNPRGSARMPVTSAATPLGTSHILLNFLSVYFSLSKGT